MIAALVIAVGPSNELGLILQLAAAGGLAGTALAMYRRIRDPDADTWMITAGGTLVGGIGGVLWLLFS